VSKPNDPHNSTSRHRDASQRRPEAEKPKL
jgi:hypothetical protein